MGVLCEMLYVFVGLPLFFLWYCFEKYVYLHVVWGEI